MCCLVFIVTNVPVVTVEQIVFCLVLDSNSTVPVIQSVVHSPFPFADVLGGAYASSCGPRLRPSANMRQATKGRYEYPLGRCELKYL